MSSLRREFGFWRAVGSMRLRDLASPEIVSGFAIGVVGAVVLVRFSDLIARQKVAGDFLTIAAALVGIVFAGFALVIGLLSDEYLRWLQSTSAGIVGFLGPFLVSTGLQVASVLVSIGYRAASPSLPTGVEGWTFGLVCVTFMVAILDVVALARSVLMHGVARARTLELRDVQESRVRRGQG